MIQEDMKMTTGPRTGRVQAQAEKVRTRRQDVLQAHRDNARACGWDLRDAGGFLSQRAASIEVEELLLARDSRGGRGRELGGTDVRVLVFYRLRGADPQARVRQLRLVSGGTALMAAGAQDLADRDGALCLDVRATALEDLGDHPEVGLEALLDDEPGWVRARGAGVWADEEDLALVVPATRRTAQEAVLRVDRRLDLWPAGQGRGIFDRAAGLLRLVRGRRSGPVAGVRLPESVRLPETEQPVREHQVRWTAEEGYRGERTSGWLTGAREVFVLDPAQQVSVPALEGGARSTPLPTRAGAVVQFAQRNVDGRQRWVQVLWSYESGTGQWVATLWRTGSPLTEAADQPDQAWIPMDRSQALPRFLMQEAERAVFTGAWA